MAFLLDFIMKILSLKTILRFCLFLGILSVGAVTAQENRNVVGRLVDATNDKALAYATVVEVCLKATYKVGNFGVVKTTDEHVESATSDEIVRMQHYYEDKADGLCYGLQGWILDNRDFFPELEDCDCDRIESNLYSAASCGIWLGGPRGRKLPGGRC